MPTHLLCMREDLDLLLARALWGIPMMLPQAAQTTLTRLMSQVTQTIALPRMPCQVTQAGEESQEGNSGQPSCKLLNLHFHSNFALLPYLQLHVMVQPPFFPFFSLSVPCPISITFQLHPTFSASLPPPPLQLSAVLIHLSSFCT